MNKIFLFLSEFVSLSNKSNFAKILAALLSTLIFLVLIYFVLLPQIPDTMAPRGLEYFPEDHDTLAQIEPNLSSSSINELYLSLRRLNSVDNLILVLSEEIKEGILTIPDELSAESDFFLINTPDREQLREDLRNTEGILALTVLTQPTPTNHTETKPLWLKIGILLLVVGFAGLTVYLIRSVTKSILVNWEGELQMVKYSGLSKFSVKLPLVLLGVIIGSLGALGSVLILLGFSAWAEGGLWLGRYLPTVARNLSLVITTGWSIILGTVLGLLSSLYSTRLVDKKWRQS